MGLIKLAMIDQFRTFSFSLIKQEYLIYLHQDTNYNILRIYQTRSDKKIQIQITAIQDEAKLMEQPVLVFFIWKLLIANVYTLMHPLKPVCQIRKINQVQSEKFKKWLPGPCKNESRYSTSKLGKIYINIQTCDIIIKDMNMNLCSKCTAMSHGCRNSEQSKQYKEL